METEGTDENYTYTTNKPSNRNKAIERKKKQLYKNANRRNTERIYREHRMTG